MDVTVLSKLTIVGSNAAFRRFSTDPLTHCSFLLAKKTGFFDIIRGFLIKVT